MFNVEQRKSIAADYNRILSEKIHKMQSHEAAKFLKILLEQYIECEDDNSVFALALTDWDICYMEHKGHTKKNIAIRLFAYCKSLYGCSPSTLKLNRNRKYDDDEYPYLNVDWTDYINHIPNSLVKKYPHEIILSMIPEKDSLITSEIIRDKMERNYGIAQQTSAHIINDLIDEGIVIYDPQSPTFLVLSPRFYHSRFAGLY